MNRVNMKQTESRRESASYAARAEMLTLEQIIADLESCEQRGILKPIGARQLAKARKQLETLIEELR